MVKINQQTLVLVIVFIFIIYLVSMAAKSSATILVFAGSILPMILMIGAGIFLFKDKLFNKEKVVLDTSDNLDIKASQVKNQADNIKAVADTIADKNNDFSEIDPSVTSSTVDNVHMTSDQSGTDNSNGLISSAFESEWAGGDRFQKHYFGGWNTNPKYTNCYQRPSWETNGCNLNASMPIDERVAQQAKMRNNEKRVIDGWNSKNMYHYRKNFSDELELQEKTRWWGNDEY